MNLDQYSGLRQKVFEVRHSDIAMKFDFSLRSLANRFKNTKFHIDELSKLEDEILAQQTTQELYRRVLHDRASITKFDVAVSAHAVAAIQSLHSISDILGGVIALAMGFATEWTGNLQSVKLLLEKDNNELHSIIFSLTNNNQYKYLCDAANHSKHCAIVEPRFMVNLKYDESNGYNFIYFERVTEDRRTGKTKTKKHPSRSTLSFLKAELNRQENIINLALNSLTARLIN